MYREDLVKLKEKMQEKEKEEDESTRPAGPKRRGVKSGSAQGKKDEPPQSSLTLEFVHG